MVPYRLLNLRPPLSSPRRSGVPPGKARRIRAPRLRRYAHQCVWFAHRQGTSAPSPCPSVARSAPGPVGGGGGGLCALCGGDVRFPEGGGGLGGEGRLLWGASHSRGRSEPPSEPTGAPPFHTRALRSGGGACLGGGRTSPITGYTCLGGGGRGPSAARWSGHHARPMGSRHLP